MATPIANEAYWSITDAHCITFNHILYTKFNQLKTEQAVRYSHFFAGRYENCYIDDKTALPELQHILNAARQHAHSILSTTQNLKIGAWFNDMAPNEATLEHQHEEDDELLSGVYYVRVPENSGKLILIQPHNEIIIQPHEGLFIFFPPSLLHKVTCNQSSENRLSIAFNIGPDQ